MNVNNPSSQDIEDAIAERFEKEDAYWKAYVKTAEEAELKAIEEAELRAMEDNV